MYKRQVGIVWDDMNIYPERHGFGFIAAKTQEKGKDLYWPALRRISDKLKLNWKFKNKANEIITQYNTIKMISLKDRATCEIAQGMPTKFVALDEPQNILNHVLFYFLDEIVGPRLVDFRPKSCIRIMANPCSYPNPKLEKLLTKPHHQLSLIHI